MTYLEVPVEKLNNIGWTKAREIAKVATKENIDILITEAKNRTRDDLEQHIKYNYRETSNKGIQLTDAEITAVKKYNKSFKLIKDDCQLLDMTLNLVKNKQVY